MCSHCQFVGCWYWHIKTWIKYFGMGVGGEHTLLNRRWGEDCKIAHELLMPSRKARGWGGDHIFDGQQVFIYFVFFLFGGRVLFYLSVECVSVLQLFPFGLITWIWICKSKIGHRYMYDKLDITLSIPRGSDYVDNHYELKYMTKKTPQKI